MVSSVTDMSWSRYADFLAFAVVPVLVPGPVLLAFSARLAASRL
jgi:hypothetical protein